MDPTEPNAQIGATTKPAEDEKLENKEKSSSPEPESLKQNPDITKKNSEQEVMKIIYQNVVFLQVALEAWLLNVQ